MDKNADATARLLFGGDFAPHGRYESLIAARGGDVFGAARHHIGMADFTMVNLEVPIAVASAGTRKVGPSLRAGPGTLRALSEAGVDAVCLANNHIFDQGRSGLSETLAALDARNIQHAGAGLDREAAHSPLRIDVRGRRISLFSLAEREFNVADDGIAGAAILDPMIAARLLLEERARANAIIVCIHGGNECFPYPRPGLRKVCQFLIDMGADAIIGHHPHVPGAYEIYRGKPIVYSLGNLIFDTKAPVPGWDEGYFAALDLAFAADGTVNIGIELLPYHQSIARAGVQLMDGPERTSFLARIEQMRDRLENQPAEWLAAWHRFVGERSAQAIIDMSSPIRFRGLRRLMASRFVRHILAPSSRQLHRLNLLRCASHQELLIHAMETQLASETPRR